MPNVPGPPRAAAGFSASAVRPLPHGRGSDWAVSAAPDRDATRKAGTGTSRRWRCEPVPVFRMEDVRCRYWTLRLGRRGARESAATDRLETGSTTTAGGGCATDVRCGARMPHSAGETPTPRPGGAMGASGAASLGASGRGAIPSCARPSRASARGSPAAPRPPGVRAPGDVLPARCPAARASSRPSAERGYRHLAAAPLRSQSPFSAELALDRSPDAAEDLVHRTGWYRGLAP